MSDLSCSYMDEFQHALKILCPVIFHSTNDVLGCLKTCSSTVLRSERLVALFLNYELCFLVWTRISLRRINTSIPSTNKVSQSIILVLNINVWIYLNISIWVYLFKQMFDLVFIIYLFKLIIVLFKHQYLYSVYLNISDLIISLNTYFLFI